MKRKNFTDKSIAALRPKASRYEIWEGGGFGVRVTPRGIKSWIWLYRFQGRARRMTLGTYPAMGLADARIKLAQARNLLAGGKDPGAELVNARRAERTAETVEELTEEYLQKWARPRKRSADEDDRILRKDVLPLWGQRKARDIRRRDVIALLDRIVARGAPIQANRTLEVVRKMFNWAISRDVLEVNPCHMVRPPSRESARDRVLRADELAQFWSRLARAGMSETIRLVMRFQLVTAQRRGEVVGAEWDEIHDGVWTIPGEKTKNGLPHRVPLPPLALDLLDEIQATAGESRWLFPSPWGEKPISGRAINHALRRNLKVIGVKDIRPHDLRRTAASHMAALGVNRLTLSKILNHVETGVTAIYDRHSYDQEKRDALEAWGRRLEEITRGEKVAANVIALRGNAS